MIYGYARCSTNESKQDINRQVRELKAAGAEEIYFEYEHGDSKVKQKQLALFDIVKEGDTLENISRKEYGDITHIEAICKLNKLEDGNLIFIGQKLLLP